MFIAPAYKTKQIFFVLIKASLIIGSFYFIFYKLTQNENLKFDVFVDFLLINNVFSLKTVLFLMILSIFNWFLEIRKWQYLVSVVQNISYADALKQSLTALSASLITPNRIGDYAAKIMYFPKTLRKRILLLNLLANIAQMSTTLIFGSIALILFAINYEIPLTFTKISKLLLIVPLVVVIFSLLIRQKVFKIRGLSLEKIVDFVRSLPTHIHFKNMILSILRYLIFSFQFYVLLILFGVELTYFNAMIIISTTYLLSSIIPSVFIFDVVVKGSIALFLFNSVGVNELIILSTTTLMWIFNFVVPCVIGSSYIIAYKSHQPYILKRC